MDCNEKGMFHTNDKEYNEFLGIGKPQGFLGFKKLFNTKGYQTAMFKQIQSSRVELTPIQSIGIKPLSIDYGTPTPYTPTSFTPTSTSGINTSDLLKNLLDTAIVIGKNKAQQGTPKTETKEETTTNETKVVTKDYNLEDARAKLKQLEEDGKGKNKTLLYVGLASVGVLLIGGFAYMSSKGK